MNKTFQEQREHLETEQQLYFGKLEEIQNEINSLEKTKKIEVEKLPNGYMLGVKHDNDNTRRQVFLTKTESEELVKDILVDIKDLDFLIKPVVEDFSLILKDIRNLFV